MNNRTRPEPATAESLLDRSVLTADDLRSFIAVVDFVPDGFAIYGPDNRLVVCNRAFRQFAGELAGMFDSGASFKDFIFAATARGLLPEANGNEQAWVESVAGKLDGEPGFAEFRYGDRWVRMRRHLLPGGYTVLHARDITSNVESRLAMQQSEALLRSVTDNVPAPIVCISRDGRYLFVNATCERWFNLPGDQIVGRRVVDVVGEAEYAKLKMYHDMILNGAQVSFESSLKYPDGVTREVEISYAPQFTDAGEISGFVGLALDVSESRAAQRELAHSQRVEALGQLTGGIAHDFNNLLTVIIGNLRLAGHLAKGSNEQVLRRIDIGIRAAFRGAELVKRLLAFSRKQILTPEVLSVDSVINNLIELLHRTMEENISIETRTSDDVPKVNCDPAQLESALLNLAINARDAMPDGGKLTIDVRGIASSEIDEGISDHVAEGEYVCLSVIDSGCGIPQKILDHVFEPFFTTKDPGQGSGLGLSMVYGFVIQSGGFVTLENAEHAGTTVRIFLPAFTGPVTPSGSPQSDLLHGDETVLVVEDEDAVREVTVAQIEALGYRVLEAATGPEALEILAQNSNVDLLFTDMVMPGGMSGLELAETAAAQYPQLKFLYTSGYALRVIESELADRSPAYSLLPKPYTDRDLALRLRSALDDQISR